ncbi:MAG: CPBP family intramembrane glutamic endopeptidase [Microbacteriaceae bacterium]
MLSIALVSLGCGILFANLLSVALPSDALARWWWAGTVALWLSLLVPIVIAARRGTPRGLYRIRLSDIGWGFAIGVLLRLIDGGLSELFTGSATWPSYTLNFDDQLPATWWFGEFIGPVFIAPVIEELFFRGVLLVSVYRLVRKTVSNTSALGIAVLASSVVFVLAHMFTLGTSLPEAISLSLLGVILGTLVARTGRIWGAVVAHVVFNASFVVLALVGTVVGVG